MNKLKDKIYIKEINQNILKAIKKNENYVIIKKLKSNELPRKLIHQLSYDKSLFQGFQRKLFKNDVILNNINDKETIQLYEKLKNNKFAPAFVYWNEVESYDEGIMLIIQW